MKKKRERFGYGTSFGLPVYLARVTKKYPYDNWRYEKTGGSIYEKSPPCPKCGLTKPGYGPDPCFGELPGVDGACCGHGIEKAHIHFTSGKQLRGKAALDWVRRFHRQSNPAADLR